MLALLKKHIQKQKRRRLVVAGAHDETIISAIYEVKEFLAEVILIGHGDKISILLEKYPLNARVIEALDEEMANVAVALIKEGTGDFLMKGMIETKLLLKAVVNRETGIRTSPLLSHVTVMKHPFASRLLFASDCAMVIAPDFNQKIHIIENAVLVAKALGIKVPKVGVISASETLNRKMPSSTDAEALSNYFKEREDMILEGPFALDNIISEKAARQKGIKSKVAGKADVLIFPGLDAGNVFYKTAVYLADMMPAGLIVGAKVPIILTSRADSNKAKLASILLAMEVCDASFDSCN